MNHHQERVTGRISLHPRGFGFLNYISEGVQSSAFIAPPDMNPFLLDDQVSAELKIDKDGRTSAIDLKLEMRRRKHLFGEIIERKGGLHLATDREVANTDWPLAGKADVGEFWLCRIDGSKVLLARRLDEDADIPLERLLARYDLREEFSSAALKQAESIAKGKQELGSRRDLRHLTTITVDAPITEDLDDAISVIPAGLDGVMHLLVSIADPAEVIEAGSPLDCEARSRGTSTYLPGRVLPMLPHLLSADALSLHPGESRHCLTVEMRIDPEGQVVAVDLYESLVCSKARVSYEELDDWFESYRLTKSLEKVEESLPWLRTASARLAVFRQRRGGLNLFGTESAEIELDSEGQVKGTAPSVTNKAHRMIERFMVAANESVANWMEERGLPGIFRVHPTPDNKQVAILSDCAYHFGYEAGFGQTLTPGALAAFDAQFSGSAAEPAIRSVLRGILGRARYTVHPGLHLGLAAPKYLHFTSPLRRYADLAVHRQIKGYLHGDRHLEVEDPEIEELSQHLNERSGASAKAESLRRRMLLAAFMERHIGQIFPAHITRVLDFGLVAQLDASLVEGILLLESLPGGPWKVHQVLAESPERRLTLGSAVRVKVVATEPALGRIEYALVE